MLVVRLGDVREEHRELVGDKGFSLARLARSGLRVPRGICVTSEAYQKYVDLAGLRPRILRELSRKKVGDMRWEEMWDAALRIRNLFLRTPVPARMAEEIGEVMDREFSGAAVAVRSSAPGEDSVRTSFAGLHASYLNVTGRDEILHHVRLVWSSLWSDAALLYRKELGLQVESATMAVLVQELVQGEKSGVAFGVSPNDPAQAVIEAVYGLNQGLVDGTVEPDRWTLERPGGTIVLHESARRTHWLTPASRGVSLESLPERIAMQPPLGEGDVAEVFSVLMHLERFFGFPQDMEWTLRRGELFVLQSRPITAGPVEAGDDGRGWHLSLRRSFDNLRSLREEIEGALIPAMREDARRFAGVDIAVLGNEELVGEVKARLDNFRNWSDIYKREFIPFAHGMRLFGQVYNDVLRPEDPYEFMELLTVSPGLESVQRNEILDRMASLARQEPDYVARLGAGELPEGEFGMLAGKYMEDFGRLPCGLEKCAHGPERIAGLMAEMATHGVAKVRVHDAGAREGAFLSRFEGDRRTFAAELLDLARASYRLRDNDNIYLGRVRAELQRALTELRKRAEEASGGIGDLIPPEIRELMAPEGGGAPDADAAGRTEGGFHLKARQIVGQPAGPGIAHGVARVIGRHEDLFSFRAREVLVCDSIDPSMTFVVPLAAGIVERRGGMLIHGAIVAREYGIPCVTGIPHATSFIRTGDSVTVDGFLGIVTIG